MGEGRKRRRSDYLKRQKTAQAELQSSQLALQAGLKMLGPDEADEIIGEKHAQGDKELLESTQSNFGILYAALCQKGCPKSKPTSELVAKAMMMQFQMVHNAFALGIRAGREEGQEEKEEA